MSSILDALKKSEAERQRGLPPTLNSPAAFHRTRSEPAKRTRWWLPAAALAGIAIAWSMGVFDFGDDVVPPAETTAATPTPDNSDAPPAVATPPADGIPAPIGADPAAPAVDESTAITTPSAGDAPPPRRGGFGPFSNTPADTSKTAEPADGDDLAATNAPAASASAPPVSPPTPAMPSADPVIAAAPTAAPAVAPETAPAAPASPPVETASLPAENPSTPEEAAAPAPTRTDGIPTLFELPFAARRALPEIAVTMHMYSTDPARRFALVNGVRVRDGESLEGGIEVVRILPDGVQVRIEGTEFVLPVSN